MADGSAADFAHSGHAESMRREKATALARYAWDRGINAGELLSLTAELRRKLARAAGVNPPGSAETWELAGALIERKIQWAHAHPDHPAAAPAHRNEKIMWIKPPITPWT